MNKKCDNCDKPATIHLTEIDGGQKLEKHLCASCAEHAGIAIKANIPISQLLENFVLQSSSSDINTVPDDETSDLTCDICGMTFAEFRSNGMLGCPNDYTAFAESLEPLISQWQDGATRHIGKIPKNADELQVRDAAMLRLRAQLRQAVTNEDYEEAASLRDRIRRMEQHEAV